MLRKFILLLSLSGFIYSGIKLIGYWDYQSRLADIKTLLYTQVSPQQLSEKVGTAINEDRLEDAKMYLAIGKRYHYPLHYDYYNKYIQERDTRLRRIKKDVRNFSTGFVTGKGIDASGISGALVSDFTVVGDARDLYEQYQIQANGGQPNKLIVTLAGIGIGLTAITYGSAGSTSVAKAGTSLFKLAARTGRLSRKFSKELLKRSSAVFDWRSFRKSIGKNKNLTEVKQAAKVAFHPAALKPLKQMAHNLQGIRKNTSLADTLHMLKYVENSNDLRRLEKFTAKHGRLSKGLLELVGRAALRSVRVIRKTTEFVISLFATVLSGIFSLLVFFSKNKVST